MSEPTLTTFYFKAGTPAGEVFVGSLAAATESQALRVLREGGYLPVRMQCAPIRESILHREIWPGGTRRLRVADCESICRELAILLGAGIELLEALSVLVTSLPTRSRPRQFATAVRHWLRMGSGLSDAVRRSGFDCPDDFIPVIRAGEETGSLATALGTLAKTYAESLRFSRLVSGALAYPAFLAVAALAVLAIIAFVVAPSLTVLFASMDRPVPPVIGGLNSAARAIGEHPILSLVAATAMMAAAVALVSTRAGRAALRQVAFALPVLGEASAWAASRRFAAALRLYLISNVPLASALPSSLAAASLPGSARSVPAISEAIRRGHGISDALQSHTRLPAKVIHLLGIGEKAGRLPEALAAIGEEASLRFERQMALMSALLAPILIVVVGTVIGGIILTVFAALLDVNDLAFR